MGEWVVKGGLGVKGQGDGEDVVGLMDGHGWDRREGMRGRFVEVYKNVLLF